MERLRLRHPFRRYWAVQLWGEVFETLLHLPDPCAPPPCALLQQRICAHMAAHPALQQRAQADLIQQAGCPLSIGMVCLPDYRCNGQ